MGNNSKASNSKLAKHINIRYYLLTDKTEKDKLSIKWCPTVDMIVYFMTKRTQGEEFKIFGDQLMGVNEA